MQGMLLEGIAEGQFRVIRVILKDPDCPSQPLGDFEQEKAFDKADRLNRKRRLPYHPIFWVYDHNKQLVRSEKDVGEPVLGLG